MKQILMIEVSPRGKDSASRSVADMLAARLTDLYPSAKLMRRDLAAEHLPHLDGITLRAISTRDPAEAQRLKEAARKSDQLTDELLGIRSSGDGNADVVFRHSLRPQSLDRPGRAAGQDLPVLRWRRPRSGEGQEGRSGSGFGWGFYGRPMAPVGFCRALPPSNPEFHRHRGCPDRSSRGDEYSPVGCQRRTKGDQSCRGTCSVKDCSRPMERLAESLCNFRAAERASSLRSLLL